MEVILLEKNSPEMLGGRCGSFDVTVPGLKGVGISGDDGGGDRGSGSVGGEGTGEGVGPQSSFRHERGPSLLLLKSEYETLFRDCGRTAEEYGLNMVQCDPAYQVVFHDGESIELGFARDKNRDAAAAMAEGERKSRSIMDGFERDGAAKWDEYMKVCFSLPSLFFISSQLDIIPTDSPFLPSWEIIVWPLRPPLRYIIAFLPPLPDFFVGISTIGFAGEREIGDGGGISLLIKNTLTPPIPPPARTLFVRFLSPPTRNVQLQASEAFLDCGLPNFIEERLDLASFPAFLRESLRDGGKVR